MSQNEEVSTDDVFNILVASDIHLGYNEKDPIRGKDTFTTFEEILSIAEQRKVDFILLGGDLFHDTKPSQNCLHQAFALLRRYCMGDRPIAVRFLSDQSENFQHCLTPIVNYEDPNFNISIPVFSIHGNHDDPTGIGRLSALDLLSISGLVNYFGKWTDLTKIDISPLLLQKGASKLALYGLSYIKDERLCRLFRERKVNFYRPEELENEWFNIFVTHQNRADRGINKSLPEWALPKFLHLVIWGHEHDCRIEPEKNSSQGFSVIQPGSPVATSLCEGEAIPKHVGILTIYKDKFNLEPIKLRTVRPFLMDTVVLSKTSIDQYTAVKVSEAVQQYLHEVVSNMIQKVNMGRSGHPKQPELPLIRLRVEYNDEMQVFNAMRFGQHYSENIANPKDMILLRKEKVARDVKDIPDFDKDAMNELLERAQELDQKVECVVEKYFESKDPLKILNIKGLAEAVGCFIEKSDKDAIECVVSGQKLAAINFMKENLDNECDNIREVIDNYRTSRTADDGEDDVTMAQRVLSGNRSAKSQATNSDNDLISDDDDDDDGGSTSKAARGRGRGRGSRGGGAAARGQTTTTRGGGPGSRGGRGSRARGRGQTNGQQTSISDSFRTSSRTSSTARKGVCYISDSDSD